MTAEQKVIDLPKSPAQAGNIHTALCAAQAEIENPPKEKTADTGKYKYKYADIADVLETVLPVLTRHGITVSQSPRIEEGAMILKTCLTHGASETSIDCDYPVCSLNGDHQKMGGALTYARRYALCTMVGVAPAEDLDGQDAAKSGDGDRKQLSAQQAKKELNWDAIISAIRHAKSHEVLDEMKNRANSNRGYWPSSFVSSALEEISTRREELDYQSRASEAKDDPSVIADMLEACQTVAGVEHLRATLQQVGVSTENIEDEFELRKAELS
ncbi:ERF family protein [Roseibium album]|uniref:ERF family protein n=1 Tax=Roseibium album TaxID=311410 RepID=UPI003BAF5CD5